MKLKSALRSLSLDDLRSVQSFWGIHETHFESGIDEQEHHRRLIEYLYPRLQIGQYFVAAFERLGVGEKDLVYFLTIHGGDMGEAELLRRFFNNESERLEHSVQSMSRKGMVYFDQTDDTNIEERLIGIPEPYLRYMTLPGYWEGYLGYYLCELPSQTLKQMLSKNFKARSKSTRHNILVYLLRKAMLDPTRLRKFIQSLGEHEREIFRMIVDRKGVCVYRDLLDSGFQKHYDHSKAEYVNNLINHSGLVFVAQTGENKYNNLLMIPRDIYFIIDRHYQEDLRPLQELDTVKHPAKDQSPTRIIDNSNNLLRDLTIVASYVNQNPIKPLASGGVGKNDLKKFMPYVSANKTPKYIGFLTLFLIQKKFLLPVGSTWRINNTLMPWLDKGVECYRELYEFWLTTKNWNEEYVDGDTHHTDSGLSNLINAPELRKLTLRNVKSIPHTRWISFDAFAESLIPQVEMNIPRRGGADRNQRPIKMVIESVVAEMMHWMGIVTLGIDDKTNLNRLGNRMRGAAKGRKGGGANHFFFKLTPLGRFIMEGAFDDPQKLFSGRDSNEMPLHFEMDYFTVQPNLDVITPPDLKLRSFYFLNEFARIKNVDVMSTLSISRETVRGAMDRGISPEEIHIFLSKSCPQGVPETVKHLIAECSDKHGELRMGFAGGFIRVLDKILLEELKANKKLKPFIKDVLDDRLIILQPEIDVRKLARELQRGGFMPQLDSENVYISSDGKYNIMLSQEELYTLMATLRFVVEMEESLGGEITQDQVAPLLERIKPDASQLYNLNYYADSVCESLTRRFEDALKKKMSGVMGKYKRQVGRLLTSQRAAQNAASHTHRFSFTGPNPATKKNDVLDLLEYALEHDLDVTIAYERKDGKSTEYAIEPQEVTNDKVYANVPSRGRFSNFFIARIAEARIDEDE